MINSAMEMDRQGHSVALWLRGQLMPGLRSRRRLLVPFVIPAKVLRAALGGDRFDVVEIHEPLAWPYAIMARLGKWARLPACVVLSHGLEERGWHAQLERAHTQGRVIPLKSRIVVPLTLIPRMRLGLCNADAVLVVSTVDRRYLCNTMDRRAERISCCFGGVSGDLFEVERSVNEQVRLLFIGSWIERKGTAELTAAWSRLAAERSSATLTVAGVRDGQLARSELADAPRVDVIPTVARADLPELLAKHDVFVLPSWFEGLPLSMLEAAAAGLPCVVSAVCGNLDVFRPDDPQRDGGILVPHSDPDALYCALITLVDDAELRLKLGARARKRARQFTWAKCADQALTAYASAIEGRGAEPGR